jgi:hypothetical protein
MIGQTSIPIMMIMLLKTRLVVERKMNVKMPKIFSHIELKHKTYINMKLKRF